MSIALTFKNHERRSNSKVVRPTANLVRTVLERLNFNGVWGVTFICQHKNRTDKRWQVARIDGEGIVVKTKPAGNDSCWELAIIPPKEYDLKNVFFKLNEIHPQRLEPPKTAEEAAKPLKLFGQDIRPSVRDLRIKEAESLVKNFASTLDDFSLIVETSAQQPVVEAPKPEPIELPKPEKSPEPQSSLAIQPTWRIQDSRTIQNALIAASLNLDPHTGHANRPLVVAAIQQHLELDNYLEWNQFGYSSKLGLSREIINVLCDSGLLNRYEPRMRVPTRRKTTAGYIITKEGREKLNQLKQYLPKNILDQLFSGFGDVPSSELPSDEEFEDDFYVDSEFKPLPEVPTPARSDAQTIGLISSKLAQLTPLMDRHEKLTADLNEFNELSESARSSVEATGYIVEGIKSKIAPLQKELERLNKQLEEAVKNYDNQKSELDYILAETAETEQNLSEIRQQLQELMR